MNVFFTADTHFGHANIIKLSKRPFASVEEMDEALIERWNARVGPEDRVYHLGDFCFKGSKKAARYLDRLDGRVTLIKGNHDTENTALLPRWEGAHDILELRLEGERLALCHYPMLEWPGAFKRALHLHGHTHGRVSPHRRRADVGVDVWGYGPVLLAEILTRLESAPEHDPARVYDS